VIVYFEREKFLLSLMHWNWQHDWPKLLVAALSEPARWKNGVRGLMDDAEHALFALPTLFLLN
jgi:hypothetical protein